MHGEVAYRQLVLSDRGGEKLRLPLLAPLNDILGWAGKPDASPPEGYITYLHQRYGRVGFPRGSLASMEEFAAFDSAAHAATKGRLSGHLAGYLERLRFAPDGSVADVPDFTALAAWGLLEAVRRQPLELRKCASCKRPWLAATDEKSRYCQRWTPGQQRDCRTLDYERRLAGDKPYRAYRREYKRVTEMQRRGSIELVDMYGWRGENNAIDWKSFEDWREEHDA
jgi:hypothetical protein